MWLARLVAVSLLLVADAARAQDRVPLVAYLGHGTEDTNRVQLDGFRDGMKQLGHVEGRSYRLELRLSDGQLDRLPELARDLLRLNPDIAVSAQVVAAQALWRETRSLPIVMAGGNGALQSGLIATLSRPGGNVTGVTSQQDDLTQKLIQLLREIAPDARRVMALSSGRGLVEAEVRRGARIAAAALDMTLIEAWADSPAEIALLPGRCRRDGCEALVTLGDPTLTAFGKQLVGVVEEMRLPAVYPTLIYTDVGGLLAYSADPAALSRRSAAFVDRILKGAKPAELPVEQPTIFNLVINLRAAKAIGLAIPQPLLLRADEVIE